MRRDRRIHGLIAAGSRKRAAAELRIYLADSERDVLDLVRAAGAEHERA